MEVATACRYPWRCTRSDFKPAEYGLSPCFYIILGFNVYANKTGVPADEYIAQQVTSLTELLTNYGPIDRLWWGRICRKRSCCLSRSLECRAHLRRWDNYALDGAIYQPVTHAGFVCPGNAYDPIKCPAWKTMIDTVRSVSPDTAIFPVRVRACASALFFIYFTRGVWGWMRESSAAHGSLATMAALLPFPLRRAPTAAS